MRGPIKFKLGGLEKRAAVPLSLAFEIEDATGVGLVRLGTDLSAGNAKMRHAVEIIRLALAANGMTYTAEQILEDAQTEGIASLQINATRIVMSLFDRPKGPTAGKALAGETPAPAPSASH